MLNDQVHCRFQQVGRVAVAGGRSGKYSLAVVSADAYDAATDEALLADGTQIGVVVVAARLVAHPAGFLLQRRLAPHPDLAADFGPRLWSLRAFVLLRSTGPLLHRAVAKIAVGGNPANNFWRPGNMLGAVDRETGRIVRTVRGTGAVMDIDPPHPDSGRASTGTVLPDWPDHVRQRGGKCCWA